MTKFFNKFKRPCFWTIFGPFSFISLENLVLSCTTSYGFLAPCQNIEKNGLTDRRMEGQTEGQKDRRKDGQKDRQIFFHRTLLITARGPKVQKACTFWDYSSVKIGFNMINTCHTLSIVYTMLVKIH